jgi:hypothetical protein
MMYTQHAGKHALQQRRNNASDNQGTELHSNLGTMPQANKPHFKNDNMVHDTAMTLLSLGKDTSFSKNSLDTNLPMPMR